MHEDMINGAEVSRILGVTRTHVSQSAKRARLAREMNRVYRGKIPEPDRWISGVPYWYRDKIMALKQQGDCGGQPILDHPELSPGQLTILSTFPVAEKAYHAKIRRGYRLIGFSYEADARKSTQSIRILFEKDYERFELRQEKHAGEFSHATFGRAGERGEVLSEEMIG